LVEKLKTLCLKATKAAIYVGMGYKGLFFTIVALALLFTYSYAYKSPVDTTPAKLYLVMLEEGADQGIVANYGTITNRFNIVNAVAVELTDNALVRLSKNPAVISIEENQTFTLEETQPEPLLTGESIGGSMMGPGSQWNLGETGINAEEAWNNFPADGTGVKIAIIDTGVNYNHELLDGAKYLGGEDFCQYRSGLCIQDPTHDPMDEYGHGTEVAIEMLASGENDGLKGIAPEAGYYAVKISDASASWEGVALLAGFEWAAEQGVDIIYLGLRSGGMSSSVQSAINQAFANGILVVGGNYDVGPFPGKYDNVVGVGAHDNEVPQNVISTGNESEVVGPGLDVPCIGLIGDKWIEKLCAYPDDAAAQVAGALALMVDFNRANEMGYSNQGLWDTLNYSAVDWADPLAGNGKADVNAALYWMENDWFIDESVNYIDPNEPGEPPVYYYENPFDYEISITNNSDEVFYNLSVTAKNVYLEGTRNGQGVTEIPDYESEIAELSPGQAMVLGPEAVILPTTIEPGLKGILVEVSVGGQSLSAVEAMTFTKVYNGWILSTAEPSGAILHLADMPSYLKEQDHYSGAAVAEMILDFVREDANGESADVTQNQIYEYAHALNREENSELLELDAEAMDAVLGKYDPYDFIVSNSMDSFDSKPDGNPFQGYSYTVNTADTVTEYMTEIVHWMAFQVPEEAWWTTPRTLVAEPNTPAALPLYGSYDKWVALNGYAVSDDPTPDLSDLWEPKSFTVFGFWLTDPSSTGIGQHVYVTAAEAEATYFQPMAAGDIYDGKYLQIAEPPEARPGEQTPELGRARVSIAPFAPDKGNLEFVGAKPVEYKPKPATGMVAMAYSMEPIKAAKKLVKKSSWRDLVDQYLVEDESAVEAFEGKTKRRPVLVSGLGDTEDYYLVPFGRKNRPTGVIMLGAEYGEFKQAAWTDKPEKYLQVSKNRAVYLAKRQVLRELKRGISKREYRKLYKKVRVEFNKAEADLVWEPNGPSQSPFKPYWKIETDNYTRFVTQDKQVHE